MGKCLNEDGDSHPPPSLSLPPSLHHFQVDYMDENEEYFQRQASHRQSRRRFRKINQKGERQTIIDTVDPYPTGKPPIARGYHTVSYILCLMWIVACSDSRWLQCCSGAVSFSVFVSEPVVQSFGSSLKRVLLVGFPSSLL